MWSFVRATLRAELEWQRPFFCFCGWIRIFGGYYALNEHQDSFKDSRNRFSFLAMPMIDSALFMIVSWCWATVEALFIVEDATRPVKIRISDTSNYLSEIVEIIEKKKKMIKRLDRSLQWWLVSSKYYFQFFLIFWNVDGCQGTTRQLKTEAVNFAEGGGMHVALQQCFNDG